jgi:hypothetical protein
LGEVRDWMRKWPRYCGRLALLINALMLLAASNGCGSSTKGAAQPGEKNGSKTGSEDCFTDPKKLALQAARDIGIRGLTSPLTMDEEQFRRFLASQNTAADAEMLWQMHRSDLDFGIRFLEECKDGPLTIDNVEQEEAPFEAFEVNGTCTSPDGKTTRFKVEQIKFEGCIYVGNIE